MFGNVGNTFKKLFQRKQDKNKTQAKVLHREMAMPEPKESKTDKLLQSFRNYKRKMKRRKLKAMEYKTFVKRQTEQLKKPGGFNFPPIKPIIKGMKTDISRDAEVFRERLRGERPTREEHRHMARMKARAERDRTTRRIRTLAA